MLHHSTSYHVYFVSGSILQLVINVQQQQPNLYSQASWGRLEMKSHEQKKIGIKQERKRSGK
jgi:hypothetical protein